MILVYAWMVLTQGIPAWFVVLLTAYYLGDLWLTRRYMHRVDALWAAAEHRDGTDWIDHYRKGA